jgi:hypothetical protein
MAHGQAHSRHAVNGVTLDKHEIGEGVYLIESEGKYLTKVSFSRAAPLSERWCCGCGDSARAREALFVHIVAFHVLVASVYKLVGHHADPTYEQALRSLPHLLAGL